MVLVRVTVPNYLLAHIKVWFENCSPIESAAGARGRPPTKHQNVSECDGNKAQVCQKASYHLSELKTFIFFPFLGHKCHQS